ncbi:MAG: hypothetical protein ACK46M_03615, partial [Planctomyces sp.]
CGATGDGASVQSAANAVGLRVRLRVCGNRRGQSRTPVAQSRLAGYSSGVTPRDCGVVVAQ